MLLDRWQSLATAEVSLSLPSSTTSLVHLDNLCALSFQGADVVKFLQGYLTCDTAQLSTDQLQPAALCNLQGRVIAFGWCSAPADNHILWLIPSDLTEPIQTFLKPYLAFSKTKLSRLTDDHLLIGVIEADTAGNIAADLSIRLITSEPMLEALLSASRSTSRAAFDVKLITAAIPWIAAATSQEFLPQMLGLVSLGAISFDKGCYLGQEVVARAQHRGRVKRQLQLLRQEPGRCATPGAILQDEAGRAVGTIVSSACADELAVSLAVLQQEAQGPFQERDTGLPLLS